MGIEMAPPSREQLERATKSYPAWRELSEQLIQQWPGRVPGVHRVVLAGVSLTLFFGDAAVAIDEVTGQMDAWFLDGFAPDKNPRMWGSELFEKLFDRTRPGGRLGSFTAAGHVRRNLAEAGFVVERLEGSPLKRHIISALRPLSVGGDCRDAVASRPKITHVAVIGAGWAGICVAESLMNRGIRVSLFDRTAPGAGASGHTQALCTPVLDAGASARQDWYRSAYVLASRRHSKCGVMRLPDKTKPADRLDAAVATFGAIDPMFLRDRARDGWFMTTAGLAHFDDIARGVVSRIDPADRHWPLTVHRLRRNERGWQVVAGNDLAIDADAVVLACGPAVTAFAVAAEWPLSVVRGQTSLVPATPASQKLDHAIVGSAYICPAENGQHTVGATFAPGDTALDERETDHADNRRRAEATAPGWAHAMDWSALQSRVGLRCQSRDYLPLIGAVADAASTPDTPASEAGRNSDAHERCERIDGLYAIAALASHGVISAPLGGELIADLICQDPLPCSRSAANAVDPARFLIRERKRRGHIPTASNSPEDPSLR